MSRDDLTPKFIAEIADVMVGISTGHKVLVNRFQRAGAPEPPPQGTMLSKATAWLERISADEHVDGLQIVGRLVQELMQRERPHPAYEQVRRALAEEGLTYKGGGQILGGSLSAPSRSLADLIQARDHPAIDQEFGRALSNVVTDPPTAVAAASAILESTFRIYIEEKRLTMPPDVSIQPLWKTVRAHLGLDAGQTSNADLKQILGGLTNIVHGVGALRTHASSAHGQGVQRPNIEPRHARLAVHAAHTVVTLVLESWD